MSGSFHNAAVVKVTLMGRTMNSFFSSLLTAAHYGYSLKQWLDIVYNLKYNLLYTGQLITEETTLWAVVLVKYEFKAALCLSYKFEVTCSKPENMLLYTHNNTASGNTITISSPLPQLLKVYSYKWNQRVFNQKRKNWEQQYFMLMKLTQSFY